jgi:acyl CoA:acetate/3-ketoacid CoA transferase alpha subunit
MRISKYFLMVAIALGIGLTACSKDDVGGNVDESNANTYVSVSLKMSSSAFRAGLPEDYNYVEEWAGKDNFSTVTVYLVDGTSVTSQTFDVATAYAQAADANGNITLTPNANALSELPPARKQCMW